MGINEPRIGLTAEEQKLYSDNWKAIDDWQERREEVLSRLRKAKEAKRKRSC